MARKKKQNDPATENGREVETALAATQEMTTTSEATDNETNNELATNDLVSAAPVGQPVAEKIAKKDKDKKKKKQKNVADVAGPRYTKKGKLDKEYYENEELRLQEELVRLQYWVKEKGLRVVIIFEGRDAAGKGGVIKRAVERTNPRIIRVVALGIPTEREKSQWYFQRWVAQLPAGGEIALFDRSWYTRAITEYVHGFCTESEYQEFLRSCPQFERMLIRSGTILLKYWFSVSDEEQERRFQQRASDPRRRWKLSPMDLKSRDKWEEYSKAKDRMFDYTDIKQSPWYVVNADDKRRARLNCISHLLSQIPYEDIMPEPMQLGPRRPGTGYIRQPIEEQTFVPEIY